MSTEVETSLDISGMAKNWIRSSPASRVATPRGFVVHFVVALNPFLLFGQNKENVIRWRKSREPSTAELASFAGADKIRYA